MDYSEYFIGHSGSTYWRKKDSVKAEIFCKIEPYLTFLNVNKLERPAPESRGMSAFALSDGVVYHTYSTPYSLYYVVLQ